MRARRAPVVSSQWFEFTNMSDRIDGPESAVEDKAIEWLVQVDGETSPEQLAHLSSWLNERPEHSEAFERMQRYIHSLRALRQLDTGDPDPEIVYKWVKRRARRRFMIPLAATCAVVATGVLAWVPIPSMCLEALSCYEWQYETRVGERLELTLQDESTVTLNTDSRISVRYDPSRRWVHLERGEAHFVVEPLSDRPFSVNAGTGTVRAIGTAFNVYIKQDVVEVTVAEGVVEVLPTTMEEFGRTSREISSTITVPKSETLVEGQTAEYADTVEVISTVAPADLKNEFTWLDGQLFFEDESLAVIVEEASRYFSAKITIEDPTIAEFRITLAVIETGDAEGFVKLVDMAEEFTVRQISSRHYQILPAQAPTEN